MELNEFCSIWQPGMEQVCRLEDLWKTDSAFRNGELPFFLSLEYFDKVIPFAKAPFESSIMRTYAEDVIRIAEKEPSIASLARGIYHGEFVATPQFSLIQNREILPFLGEKYTGFFYFMISLGAFPLMVERCRKLGIPEWYARNAMAWFGGTMIAYKRAHAELPGRPGNFSWIRKYIEGILFRIGRLEYLIHRCPDWIPPVFRNESGETVALCCDGWKLDDKWVIVDSSGNPAYTTHIRETRDQWEGNLILPDGTVDIMHTCVLDKRIWKPVVSAWDCCPSIHIPAGGHLPFDEVKSSLIAARDFFSVYFHRQVPLFCCNSWILNAAWERLLPRSNITAFRRQGYAVPSPDWGELGGTSFIFGRDDLRPEEMTARNHIEKAMQTASVNHENNAGTVFFLSDDLKHLGNEYYREKCTSLCKEKR